MMRSLSIHDYYPFGWERQLTTVNPYPFTYQGQLFDRELGWQYYRYRNYDPLVARFWQAEPLVDSFPERGVYVFVVNNPIFLRERYGLQGEPTSYMVPVYKSLGKMAVMLEKSYGVDFSRWVDDPYGSMEEVNEMVTDLEVFTSSVVGSAIALYLGVPPIPMISLFVERQGNVDWVGPAWTQAYGIFFEWVSGTGPEVREFGESEPITRALKESALTDAFLNWLVNEEEGKQFWNQMKQGKKAKGFQHVNFNVSGEVVVYPFMTPLDDIAQFIGSATYSFEYDPETNRLNITVKDTKTPFSFFYHMVDDQYTRDKLKFLGKTTQIYKFSLSLEDIEKRVNDAK